MDVEDLVGPKLLDGDKCIAAVLGAQLEDGGKRTRIVALVYSKGDSALFLYSCSSFPAQSPEDLLLVRGIPVDSQLTFSIVGQPSDGKVPVKITNASECWIFELPADGLQVNLLLSELKNSISVHARNAGKGLPPSFSWIDKYSPLQGPAVEVNPFAEDVFDPLRLQNTTPDDTGWPWSHILQPSEQASTPVVRFNPFTDSIGMEDRTQGSSDTLSSSGSFSRPSSTFVQSMPKSGSMDDLDEVYRGGKPLVGRENTIRLLMKERENEYTDLKYLTVFCGTWNVNGQPATEKLHRWLACDEEPPDIYAIGFQELDLSKNAFIFSDSPREQEWYQKVKEALHPKAHYIRLKLIRLVGMMLIVFIQDRIKEEVSFVAAETVGTGIMGMMGNKGGVAVRLEVDSTSLCFVNTHLAAHTEEFERRNQDYRDINSRMKLTINGLKELSISDHDLVFWIGDLNYRLSDIDNEAARSFIGSRSYEKLLLYDQLYQQKNLGNVFLDYTEGPVTFQPTYKYDPGTDNWDTSEKCRTPAWCDRILYRGPNIQQNVYRSHMDLKLSDHKPVSSIFKAGVKVIDSRRQRKVYEDILKQMDKRENDFLPQATLNTTELRFKDVKFIEPQSRKVVVTNTGQVPIQFEFIKKLDDTEYCKPWLRVEPNKAVINTNDTCEIDFEVYVDASTAAKLNSGAEKIEDIVVLHLDGGKDFFLTVTGNYIPSSFGSSIEALIKMFGPIREVEVAQLIDLELGRNNSPAGSPDSERPLDVPKELYLLVDHIYRYGLQQEDLFQQPGLHKEEEQIREALDTGSLLYTESLVLPGSIHSVAESLLLFLEALAEPVIPCNYYYKCLECCNNHTLCKQVLSQMPLCHQTVFKYLTAFLRTLLRHANTNNLDSKILASQFGKLLLRAPANGREPSLTTGANRRSQQENEDRKKAAFVYQFLVNDSLD